MPVTTEPTPTRIASARARHAELDAVDHLALDELTAAVAACGIAEQIKVLDELATHRRLRDLSELVGVVEL